LRTTLDNGLKVVLLEDRSAPVVALNVWVRTGSAEETEAEAGMAHVFEHMLFKGTERRAVGEIARTVEAAGGNINAFTSFDMTVYHITMASRDVAVGIDVLADAILNSTFDPGELDREIAVVLEEIRRGEDSPNRVLSQEMFSQAYTRHPYRDPVIGTSESVSSFSREQDPVRLRFGRGPGRPGASARPGARADGAALGDRAPRLRAHADRDRLSHHGVRRGGHRLRRPARHGARRRRELAALPQRQGPPPARPHDRRECVHAARPRPVLRPGDARPRHDRARAAGDRRGDRPPAQLRPVRRRARKLGYYEALGGGIELEDEYMGRLRRATTADLQRVAQQYLLPERATVAALLPEAERPDLEAPQLIAALGAARQAARAVAGEEIHEGIWRYVLPNGLPVIIKPNHAIPLVSMRLAFLGGQLAETEETQGISSFTAEMLERGTTSRSAAQIAAEVEGIAGGLEGFSGRNSFGLTGEFLTENLDTGLDLFADVLLEPSFPADEIEKLRTDRIAAIKRREDDLAGKAFELFAQALYPNHPYRFRIIGNEESARRVDRAALIDFYRTRAAPKNGVLSVVGDVEPEQIVEALESRLGGWTGPDSVELPERPSNGRPPGPRDVSVVKDKQQVHLVLGFPGLTVHDPDLPALEVLTQILAGQGGRLFLELRDRRSLAYTVTAFSIEGLDPGSFGVYIASAPDKREESLEGLRSELQRLLDEPIDPDELERARAYLIGSHAVALQRYGLQASLLALDELYGLGATHYLDYARRIEAVTLDDVKRVAQRLVDLDAPITAQVL
jgi:predicted Zn-dependent peptidase